MVPVAVYFIQFCDFIARCVGFGGVAYDVLFAWTASFMRFYVFCGFPGFTWKWKEKIGGIEQWNSNNLTGSGVLEANWILFCISILQIVSFEAKLVNLKTSFVLAYNSVI